MENTQTQLSPFTRAVFCVFSLFCLAIAAVFTLGFGMAITGDLATFNGATTAAGGLIGACAGLVGFAKYLNAATTGRMSPCQALQLEVKQTINKEKAKQNKTTFAGPISPGH